MALTVSKSEINSDSRFKIDGRRRERKCRPAQGFSLVEQLLSLLIVVLAAVLLVRMSAANAIVSQQSVRRMSAVRLGSELSAWIQRSGHLALGTSINQALDQLRSTSVAADVSAMCCPPAVCDANASAWQYLSLWQTRLNRAVPDARMIVCFGKADALTETDWSCEPEGSVLLMKLGWPRTAAIPSIVMPLGAVR